MCRPHTDSAGTSVRGGVFQNGLTSNLRHTITQLQPIEKSHSILGMVNIVLSNVKRSLGGTYHAIMQGKYARCYQADAAYRFNRRFRLRGSRFLEARAFGVQSHSFKEIEREKAFLRRTDHRLFAGKPTAAWRLRSCAVDTG